MAIRIDYAEQLQGLLPRTVIQANDGELYRVGPYEPTDRRWYPAWTSGNAYERDFGVDASEVPLPAVVVLGGE